MSTRLPDWPRMLQRRMAAAYCGIEPSRFDKAVAMHRLPQPINLDGLDLWSRPEIDEALNRLAGTSVPDWRDDSPLYNQAHAA
jgi:predicted DNA-binding transcriptional regulator AlpA